MRGKEGRARDRGEHGKLIVGFDARWYNDSGVGTYVAGLLDALSRLPEVELVAYGHPANPVPDLGADCARRTVHSGKYSALSQIHLARLCRQDRLHVFHSPFYMVPFLADCPVVVTMHDLIPFLFPIYSPAKQSLVKVGYKAAIKKAAHMIAVSEQTACDLRNILHVPAERITVIHDGVRRDIYGPEKQPGEFQYLQENYHVQPLYVMAASARNWQTKNLPVALAALDLARQISGIDFSVVVFGPKEGLNKIGSLPSNVLAVGHIPAPDLAMLFRNAHAFIAPSLYEGFGLPVLEAMSCGCAVIASNRGALPEITGSGGQIFEPFDIAAIAHAVAQLLCDQDALERRRNSALQRAAHFSWERAARETLRVYHHVAFGEQPGRIAAAAD